MGVVKYEARGRPLCLIRVARGLVGIDAADTGHAAGISLTPQAGPTIPLVPAR